MSPIFLVGASVLLFGLGLGLGLLIAHSQSKRVASKAADIQKELDDYRRHVTEHFGETAQHFQALGQQYQALYKHMAKGADALCDPAQSDALLGFTAGHPAALAADANDDPEEPPKVVKDYATEDEIDSVTPEPEVEVSDSLELAEDLSPPEDLAAEPAAEEVIEDQVDTPATVETGRTMH